MFSATLEGPIVSMTVFVSAVSNEFHHKDPKNPQSFESYRAVLTRSLRLLVRDCTVVVQEELIQGLGDLLATLDQEVQRSTIVIHLVGDMTGNFPEAAEVRRLQERHSDWLAHEPELANSIGDGRGISYTQWEAYLAFQHRSGRLVFVADMNAPRSPRFMPDDEQRSSQARHRERLRSTGEHYDSCYDQRDLARKAIASIERHGLRRDEVKPSRPEAVEAAKENASAFALEIGMLLRNTAKTVISDYDPAGIEAFLNAVDTASLKRELDRRTALVVLNEHRAEVRDAAANDPTPENLYDLAFAELALGHYVEGIDAARRLAEEQVALMLANPDRHEQHREQGLNAYLLWHEAAQMAGNGDSAIEALEQGGSLVDRDREPVLWADIHEPLAEYFLAHALFDKAEPLIDEIIDIREDQGENDPALPKSLLLWCHLLSSSAKYQSVIDVAARAERLLTQQVPLNLSGIASAISWRANALLDLGHFHEAEPLMPRVVSIFEKILGENHPFVAIALSSLARLLKATNRLAEAEPLSRRALAIDEQHYGDAHPNVAKDLSNLAQLLLATNRPEEAESLLRRGLAIEEQSRGPYHPFVAIQIGNLAQLLQETNRPAEAEPLMRRALAINVHSYGDEHPVVATSLNNLARLLQDTNRLAEAEPLHRRALAIDEQNYGDVHPNISRDLNNLATLLLATNRLEEAEPLMRRGLAIEEQLFGDEHPNLAHHLNNLGMLLRDANRLAEAEPLMARMVSILELFGRQTGHEHPHMQTVIRNYRQLLVEMGLPPDDINRRVRAACAK